METMEPNFDDDKIKVQDSPPTPPIISSFSNDFHELQIKNISLVTELEAIRLSNQNLEFKLSKKDEEFIQVQQQKEDSLREFAKERGSLRDEIHKVEILVRGTEEMRREDGELKEEKSVRNELFPKKNLGVIKVAKSGLVRIIESLDEDGRKIHGPTPSSPHLGNFEITPGGYEWNPSSPSNRNYKITQKAPSSSQFQTLDSSSQPGRNYEITSKAPPASSGHRPIIEPCYVEEMELKVVSGLVDEVELKLSDYKEVMKKENRELEKRVASLTDENRDINGLLRIALVEKEALKKKLNRLKGNNEQKRMAFLQIAERGLQKVGFGFMIGNEVNEQLIDNTGDKSDVSESEEEVVSLASTFEKIMTNLRLEITQLRTSLEESRSDAECLQSIADKQAQKLAENALRIEELENREMLLTKNIEAQLAEIKETEEEILRWREACELEVKAGNKIVEERDRLVNILKKELQKTSAALDTSNRKIKLKDDLVAAAVSAREAAERSLQLADNRAAGDHENIEELTRQLEEEEKKDTNRHRMRHICWPWKAFKLNPTNNTANGIRKVRHTLPEMQAFLHYH